MATSRAAARRSDRGVAPGRGPVRRAPTYRLVVAFNKQGDGADRPTDGRWSGRGAGNQASRGAQLARAVEVPVSARCRLAVRLREKVARALDLSGGRAVGRCQGALATKPWRILRGRWPTDGPRRGRWAPDEPVHCDSGRLTARTPPRTRRTYLLPARAASAAFSRLSRTPGPVPLVNSMPRRSSSD